VRADRLIRPVSRTLRPGRAVTVRVPATSANLGAGFDCFGLALDWYDSIVIEVVERGFTVEVTGEGATALPRDERHLVLDSALRAFRRLDVAVPGLRLVAHNTIPHGRGLGSSSAAIVSGLRAAVALAGDGVDPQWLATLADEIEGHPDNVAAAVYGGFVLAYRDGDEVKVATAPVAADIGCLLYVPDTPLATARARGLLPATVPLTDATANISRAALLVKALAGDAELLFDATEDRLHQDYRAPAMPESNNLLRILRNKGFAAVVSGAGPTVLVLGNQDQLAAAAQVEDPAFRVIRVGVGRGAEEITPGERCIT
jgi:homoserine kinase